MTKRIESGMAGKRMGFKYLSWIEGLALRYGLTGETYIKEDGSIFVIAEGEEKYLEKFTCKLSVGRFWHRMENFYADWSDATGKYSDFIIVVKEEDM